MFQFAFIDFDNTLYDTQAFRKEVVAVLGLYGVGSDVATETLDEAVHGKTGTYYNYTFLNHLELVQKKGCHIPIAEVLQKLNTLIVQNYTLPGAEEFLTTVRHETEKTILLTAGNEQFQKQKLKSTGLKKYFDTIAVVNEEKETYVATLCSPDTNSLFVNDNLKQNIAVKKLFPEMMVITIVHPKYSKEELESAEIPYFYTLNEIQTYVRARAQ